MKDASILREFKIRLRVLETGSFPRDRRRGVDGRDEDGQKLGWAAERIEDGP